MPRTRRIVAGVSASPGNLPALRQAADLARVYDAALTFVHAWLPSGPEFAAWQFPSGPLVMQWQDDAWQRMWHALDTAFGGLPPDLEAEPLVMRGNPGPVLVGAASRDGDRLVVGAGRRGTFGRLRHGRVSRYCLAHAGCPVIAVPSPALNRAAIRARDARVPDLTTAGRPSGAPGSNTVGDHGRMPWQSCDSAWSASRYFKGGRGWTTRAGSRTPGSTCC
jgi:nucleotide-binding universal stress UspA family protein